jgi:phage-related protein
METFPAVDSKGKRIPNPSRPLTEGVATNDLVFTADSGHEQRRQKGVHLFTFELKWDALTLEAYQTIRNFYIKHTTTKSFRWIHPLTSQELKVRFTSETFSGENFAHRKTGPIYKAACRLKQVL